MRNLLLLVTALGLGGLLFACGDGANVNTGRMSNSVTGAANTVANTVTSAANSVANAVSGATTSSPESFMKDAAQGGMAEVKMGELAAKNAKDPKVKKFGRMMVTEHGAAGKDLEALAKKKNITLPTDIGSHQSTYDKLSKMTGPDFDKEYVNEMVSDHESDLKTFEKQAENSSDPDVKAFAAKGVAMIKKHLEAINAIKAKIK
jgi:putative membrane protein